MSRDEAIQRARWHVSAIYETDLSSLGCSSDEHDVRLGRWSIELESDDDRYSVTLADKFSGQLVTIKRSAIP